MENFALKSIPHKIYDYTFLNQVIIQIGFEEGAVKELVDSRVEELKTFFFRFFQTDFVKDDINVNKGISLDNGNGMTYEFSLSHISVKIRRSAYKSFLETALVAAFPLKQFCYNVLGLKSVNDIFILKKSLFPFKIDKNESAPDTKEMWPVIFSKKFIDFPIDDTVEIDGAVYPVEIRQFISDNIEMAISVGVGASKITPGSFGVILDIIDKPEIMDGLTEGEFDNMLLKLNDKIFDAFHWVVSDSIISLMENK